MKRLIFIISIFIYCFEVFSIDYEGHYIAHAGGGISGFWYTNTLEALNYSYEQGFRYFELDLVEDKYGNIVAAHDWETWQDQTNCDSIIPVSKEHFKDHKIYDLFTPLDMDDINEWFSAHSDAVLVTDKINDPEKVSSLFIDKNRLYMELFSFDAIEKAKMLGINYMMSENVLYMINTNKYDYIINNEIPALAVSRRLLEKVEFKDLFISCKESGVKLWVFNVNFDPGKDEKFVYENEMQYIYGMYADNWIEEFSMPLSILDVNSGKLKVYYTGNLFNVESESEIKSIAIYNVSGKLLANYADINNLEFQTLIEHNDGLLIIKIETTDSSKILKLF